MLRPHWTVDQFFFKSLHMFLFFRERKLELEEMSDSELVLFTAWQTEEKHGSDLYFFGLKMVKFKLNKTQFKNISYRQLES